MTKFANKKKLYLKQANKSLLKHINILKQLINKQTIQIQKMKIQKITILMLLMQSMRTLTRKYERGILWPKGIIMKC